MDKTILHVGLGERSYPIHIGAGLLPAIGAHLGKARIAGRYAVISDSKVGALYGERVRQSLAAAGIDSELILFPAGESSKHLATIGALAEKLADHGFDRGDGLLALGGGVTGDITGFLASIYMRGIPFVQVPTSLLAQVDSSVGGKTGVDIPQGKNLIGTFYQPRAVFIDTTVLDTLAESEFLGGLAEVIKYGAGIDADFFDYLHRHRDGLLRREPQVLMSTIRRCCEIKASVVERDEREGGLRRILNFGHTIGHAVEAASGYRLIHGLAVAIGMRAVAELAVRTGYARQDVADAIADMLIRFGLPTTIPIDLDRAAIRRYLRTDKKAVGGRLFFVLPEAIGKVVVTDQVDEAAIDEVLKSVYPDGR